MKKSVLLAAFLALALSLAACQGPNPTIAGASTTGPATTKKAEVTTTAPTTAADSTPPVGSTPSKLIDIAFTVDGFMALDEDAVLWQMGDDGRQAPKLVADDVAQVDGLGIRTKTCILKNDGTLYELERDKKEYTLRYLLDDVVQVSVGALHYGAVRGDGSLWMWGYTHLGQLGDVSIGDTVVDTFKLQSVPVKIMDGVSKVSCGASYTAAIKDDGSLWMWGSNWAQQSSANRADKALAPKKIMDNVVDVDCDTVSAVFLVIDEAGQLRLGEHSLSIVPAGTYDNRKPAKALADDVEYISIYSDGIYAIKPGGNLLRHVEVIEKTYMLDSDVVQAVSNPLGSYPGNVYVLKTDGTVWSAQFTFNSSYTDCNTYSDTLELIYR